MKRRRASVLSRGAAAVAALAAVSLLAACGGDSDKKSDTTAAKTNQPTGEPIVVAGLLPIGQAAADFAQAEAGLKAGVRAINDSGGIKGRPVVLKACNTLLDPNQEAACARQAVDEKAVAMLAPFNVINYSIPSILEKGKIASINPPQAVPEDFTSPINFPMTGDAFGSAGCGGLTPKSAGVKKLAALTLDLPGAEQAGVMAGKAAEKAGATYVGGVPVSLSVTDMGPVVQKLAEKDPDYVYIATQPELIPQLLSTAKSQGHDWTYCFAFPVQYTILEPLGAAADKFYMVGAYPPLDAAGDDPLMQQFKEQMKVEEDSGNDAASMAPDNNPDQALGTWLAVQTFKQVASEMSGDITNATFLDAINKAKVTFDGFLPDIDFSKPNPDPAYPRVFNDKMLLLKWNPDSKKLELAPGVEPTSAKELL